MGESKFKRIRGEEMLLSCAGVQTAGGRVQVRWEAGSAATPMGQLAYFIEFLTLTGLWSGWQDRCPLSYTSPNAPSKADVLGTWMLSILSGHRRYSHVTTIRCDGVNPGLLGMKKVVSEDGIMRELEARAQPYLFKLRLSKNVKRHIERLFCVAGWTDAGQGWEGIDSTLALTGWETKRRVVVLRRPLQGEMLVAQEDNGQQLLGFIEADRKAGKRINNEASKPVLQSSSLSDYPSPDGIMRAFHRTSR
jgi:hypothetical protein